MRIILSTNEIEQALMKHINSSRYSKDALVLDYSDLKSTAEIVLTVSSSQEE